LLNCDVVDIEQAFIFDPICVFAGESIEFDFNTSVLFGSDSVPTDASKVDLNLWLIT